MYDDLQKQTTATAATDFLAAPVAIAIAEILKG
jgi:hypothetical protein